VQERAHLLRELDHRVRNNLSVMLGLVSMERSRRPPRDSAEALETLESRMRSFLLVHEALRRENYLGVPVRDFVGRLTQRLRNAFALEDRVHIDIDTPDVAVGERDGFALALILNELLTNTFRHAFPSGRQGRVDVRLTIENGEALLEVSDDGAGESAPDGSRSEPGSGRSIVNALAHSELSGTVEYPVVETGTTVRVRFPFESA
jgi:two-component sensor histidine kinase